MEKSALPQRPALKKKGVNLPGKDYIKTNIMISIMCCKSSYWKTGRGGGVSIYIYIYIHLFLEVKFQVSELVTSLRDMFVLKLIAKV